jgi:hypothetical protein
VFVFIDAAHASQEKGIFQKKIIDIKEEQIAQCIKVGKKST